MEEVPASGVVFIGVRSWWSFLIRGLIAIAFGVILLAWPASTIKVLAYLVGILALIEGVIATIYALVLAFRKEKMSLLLVSGLINLLIGILLITKTGFTLTVVVVLIAIWAIIFGLVEFFGALELPPDSGRGWIAFGGLLYVILGILLLFLPLETVYAAIVVFSIILIIGGLIRLVFAFYAYRFQKQHTAA